MLAREAKASKSKSVVAVSHSTYIKVMLGLLLDESLIDSASRKINNGSITVIDIPTMTSPRYRRVVTSKSHMFTGGGGPKDFKLEIPNCKVVRMNETRHLPIL